MKNKNQKLRKRYFIVDDVEFFVLNDIVLVLESSSSFVFVFIVVVVFGVGVGGVVSCFLFGLEFSVQRNAVDIANGIEDLVRC